MKLFREGPRDSVSRIMPGQSSFDWLDNSAKPGADGARENLQALFDELPADAKLGIANRIRGGGADHEATIAEIYFHELFRQSGYAITLDPVTPRGSRPEFLIETEGFRAYVEVTTDTGAANAQKEHQAFDDLICRVSERVATPGFGILIGERRKGSGNPSPNRMAKFVDKWFQTFDHETERTRLKNSKGDWSAMPTTVYDEPNSGWRIEMTLWPLESSDKRLKSIAGTSGISSGWCNSEGRLEDNIRTKLKQHGGSDLPVIVCVALNDYATEPDQEDVVNVLLGKSHWLFQPDTGKPAVHQREWNGFWAPGNKARNTKFNNLALVRGLYAWTLKTAEPEIWDRPDVEPSVRLPVWPFRRLSWEVPGSGQMKNVPGYVASLQNKR